MVRYWKETKGAKFSKPETRTRRLVSNWQKTLGEMMKYRTKDIAEVEMKIEENFVDLVDPAVSFEVELHVKQAF